MAGVVLQVTSKVIKYYISKTFAMKLKWNYASCVGLDAFSSAILSGQNFPERRSLFTEGTDQGAFASFTVTHYKYFHKRVNGVVSLVIVKSKRHLNYLIVCGNLKWGLSA